MTTILGLLMFQGVLGAWDTAWYHEWNLRLPTTDTARRELRLHALRDFAYAVIFGSMAWRTWDGWWVALFAALLLFEIAITLADFIEEDRTRTLPAGERVMHTIMAIVYGAFLAHLIPQLVLWSGRQNRVFRRELRRRLVAHDAVRSGSACIGHSRPAGECRTHGPGETGNVIHHFDAEAGSHNLRVAACVDFAYLCIQRPHVIEHAETKQAKCHKIDKSGDPFAHVKPVQAEDAQQQKTQQQPRDVVVQVPCAVPVIRLAIHARDEKEVDDPANQQQTGGEKPDRAADRSPVVETVSPKEPEHPQGIANCLAMCVVVVMHDRAIVWNRHGHCRYPLQASKECPRVIRRANAVIRGNLRGFDGKRVLCVCSCAGR